MTPKQLIIAPSLDEIAARLRALRIQRRLTLVDVERLSKGEIGSVVLGSYERGARALSVKKIIQLATFYEVPVEELMCGNKGKRENIERKSTIDFQKTRDRSESDIDIGLLANFLSGIAHLRGDWNGQIITIRESDLRVVGLICRRETGEVRHWLSIEGLLIK
jgi:transcriptional regulator with XRE-family HTH domain